MPKDPNKEVLDNIKNVKPWGASSEEEMDAYVKQKNQQQKVDGILDEDNSDTIYLHESPSVEAKKERLRFNVWGIAIVVGIVVIAVIACMKLSQ